MHLGIQAETQQKIQVSRQNGSAETVTAETQAAQVRHLQVETVVAETVTVPRPRYAVRHIRQAQCRPRQVTHPGRQQAADPAGKGGGRQAETAGRQV